jgi:hypothetical protein
MSKSIDEYSEQEAKQRLEAALRGARLVGHKPQSEMKLGKSRAKSMTPKGAPAQSKKP